MDVKKFEVLLDEYLANKRDEMKEKYNRVLPVGELLFNRFDKAEYLGYDKTTSVYDSAVIMGDVKIGKNCWIGPNTLIEGISAKVSIGDYVSIAAATQIYSHDSSVFMLSGGKSQYVQGAVSIGSNVAIGAGSIIYCGISIGSRCVIGANSFVNTDIPDNSIAAGSPARIIGEVIINEDGTARYKYKPTNAPKSGGGGGSLPI